MKKNLNLFFAAFAAFAVVLSCSKVEEPANDSQEDVTPDEMTGDIIISATLSDVMTKVSFDPTYDGGKPQSLALAWEEDDRLRVYNHADKTQYADFEIDSESVGQKTGRFTGTIFSAQSYDVEVICGEVEYATQTQPADGETSALKYLASVTDVTSLSSITFTELSSVLALTAKMPEGAAAGIASVDITASEAIFSTGKTLTINLAQKGDAGEDGILNLFAHLPKGNQQIAEGTTLLVRFNAPDTDHTVYTRYVELDPAAFTAGKLNTININATESETHAGLTSCDGSTAEKAYLIGDKYQLQAMGSLMTADATTYFKMVDDVDLGGAAWTSVSGKVSFEGNNYKISNVAATNGLFTSLDGSVQNLVIDAAAVTPTANNAGVLADVTVSGASIKNITITNSSISGKDFVGGLVGVLEGSVENVQISCPVTGAAKVGGLVGEMKDGSLKNISVTGLLTCTYQYAGGLVALMDKGSVENCSFTADLNYTKSATYANVGGLIGELTDGTVTSSYATGNVAVTGGDNVGGLVGLAGKGSVINCYATGEVKADTNRGNKVGGLIGNASGSLTISNCHATGNVSAKNSYVGGLVGYFTDGSVENCYATGNVTAPASFVGGLVGQIDKGKVEKCYAAGSATAVGVHYVGGLVGRINGDVTVSKSYATGAVGDASKNHRGGLIGNIAVGTSAISDCYVAGSVVSSAYSGGFIGGVETNATAVNIKNSYTKATVSGATYTSLVFVGAYQSTISCSGCIGWNVSDRHSWGRLGSSNIQAPDGNYMGKDGTISAKAREFEWDQNIWDLSGAEPVLKWTLETAE